MCCYIIYMMVIATVIITGARQPASTSSQSHSPTPEYFCVYSTAHMAVNTATSERVTHTRAIAMPCMSEKSVTCSNKDSIPMPRSISNTHKAKPTYRCDVRLLSFNQSNTFILYYLTCSTNPPETKSARFCVTLFPVFLIHLYTTPP